MEATEVRKLAELEGTHWWYRERRHLLAREVADLRPGVALDVGAAGGGNTRVLRDLGWRAVAVEYGAEGAGVAHERHLPTLRGDATALPVADASADLVVAFDVLEHIEDDDAAVAHVFRALKPGGRIVMPASAMLSSIFAESDSFDALAGPPEKHGALDVIYLPFATRESSGISEQPAADRPWLMFPGKPWAHVMLSR